jgi:predicted transcriptional regulator
MTATTTKREKQREALKASALTVWEDFQATGAHVTADRADEWLARLEAGEEAPPPEGRLYQPFGKHERAT